MVSPLAHCAPEIASGKLSSAVTNGPPGAYALAMTLSSWCVTLLVGASLCGQAPEPRMLPATTEFVVHLDVPRCIAALGNELIDSRVRAHGKEAFMTVLGRVKEKWGFDCYRDLLGITVFGGLPVNDDESGSVMIWANDRVHPMVRDLTRAGAIRREDHHGLEFGHLRADIIGQQLDLEEKLRRNGEAWIYSHRVGEWQAFLFGADAENIAPAARVLGGVDPSLASAGASGLRVDLPAGAICYLEVKGPLASLIEPGPASEIARRAQRLTAWLAAHDGILEARANIALATSKEAEDVAAIVEGLRRLVALRKEAAGRPPAFVRRLLGELRCRAVGCQVELRVSAPIRTVQRELLAVSERSQGRQPRKTVVR
ncbi:MAG: hypothetical protein NXI31_00845 [bacterium]|nr:hypothetical protein [bacterium]